MAKLHPTKGGCWFCHLDAENELLVFDTEFDTHVHKGCIRNALKEDVKTYTRREAETMRYLL